MGFEVRKKYTNKRKFDGKIRSCRYIYVYENEGHRVQDKMNFGVFVGFNSLGNSGFFVLLS